MFAFLLIFFDIKLHALRQLNEKTSGYATWFTAGGAICIAHYDVIADVIIQKLSETEKNGDHLAP